MDVSRFLNGASERIVHYEGSLTTPPCTECVNWYVVDAVQGVSSEQVAVMEKHWKQHTGGHCNYRKVQPINGRTIARNFE